MAEMNVGIRELKMHLSRYLRQVKAGKTIIITEHGKPIGQLMPAARSLEDRLEAMIRTGQATWNGKKLRPFKPTVKLRGGKSIADLISEDRE